MLGRMELRGNRPRDGRHCDLCGCSYPAVRCDKCGSQIFCLSCDDMYHRHPKRRFHLRKAVDPQPSAAQARPVLPAKVSQIAPGDPSKMPLPPPRKKKPGRSFFDTFRRGSPSSERDVSPTLPKKEYNWTDRLGSIKKFMSNRPLPPLPNGNSSAQENSPSPDVPSDKHDLSFIHKRVDEKPPQLPQRNMKPQMNPQPNSQDMGSFHHGHFNGGMANSSANGPNFARNRGFSLGGEAHQNSDASDGPKYKTINRHPHHGHMQPLPYPPEAQSGMHQSTSATDLHKLPPEAMGMPHAYPPHYPMNVPPHYPYPMYPQYPNYPQYFGSSWANLAGIPQNNDEDGSDHSEASSRHFSNKRHHFRKRAKRSQSVMVDRMGFPGPYYPFGPFPPGYAPGGWVPPHSLTETSASPSGSVNALNRIGRTRQGRRKTTSEDEDDDYEEDEFSPSSSPVSRTKSSSSERPRAHRKPVRTGTESSSEEQERGSESKDGGANQKFKRRGSNTRLTSPIPKQIEADSKSNSKNKRRDSDEAVLEKQESEIRKEENVSERTPHAEAAQNETLTWIPTDEWQCRHCTFINQPNARICQVCCKTAARSPESSQTAVDQTQPAADSSNRKVSESSEVSCSSPEKGVSSKREKQDMAVLNSALDEAEKEISRGLEELLKMKEDFSAAETSSQAKQEDHTPLAKQDAKSTEQSKPVYKSSGKLRSGILDKLTSSNQFTTPTKSNASTSTNTETQTTLVANNENVRRTSTSSTTSETFNSPTAQSPEVPPEGQTDNPGLRRDSSCQTQQSSLADYLQRKKAEEESAYLGRPNYDYNAYPLNRYEDAVSPSPFLYPERGAFGHGLMQRSHSRASLYTGRYNEAMDYVDRGYGFPPMYRSVSRGSLSGEYPDGRFSEFSNLRKPDYYLSMEELVERRRQDNIRAQGLELVRMIREAEQQGFTADDIQAALNNCNKQNPVDWLQENWRNMVDNVVALSTNYGNDKKENNDIGVVAESEARDALRLHKGNIWAAVTECVEGRQRKFLELSARGKFSRKSIVDALSSSQGEVETAHDFLTKSGSKPFLMRIWGAGEGVQNLDGALSGSMEDLKKNFHQYPDPLRKYDDDEESEEIWVEDDMEEYEDEWAEEEDLNRPTTEQQDHSSEMSEVVKSPESEDRSEYIDAVGSDDRSLSSPSSDDLFFVIPDQQKPRKSSFLSKLAAFRKETKQKQQSSLEESSQRETNYPLESNETVTEDTAEQNKSYGPLNVLRNTLSAIKDTVTGSSSKSDKLNLVIPDKRIIVVSDVGQKFNGENSSEGCTFKAIDPDEFKHVNIQSENVEEEIDDYHEVMDDSEPFIDEDTIKVADKEVMGTCGESENAEEMSLQDNLDDVINSTLSGSTEIKYSTSIITNDEIIHKDIEETISDSLHEHLPDKQTYEFSTPETTTITKNNNLHEERYLKLKDDTLPEVGIAKSELCQISNDVTLKESKDASSQENKESVVENKISVLKSEVNDSELLSNDQENKNTCNEITMKEDDIPLIRKTQEQNVISISDDTNPSTSQTMVSKSDRSEQELYKMNKADENLECLQSSSNEKFQHLNEVKHQKSLSPIKHEHLVESPITEKTITEFTAGKIELAKNIQKESILLNNKEELESKSSSETCEDITITHEEINKIETNLNIPEKNSFVESNVIKNKVSNDLQIPNKLDEMNKLHDIQFIDKEVKDNESIKNEKLNITETNVAGEVPAGMTNAIDIKKVDETVQKSLELGTVIQISNTVSEVVSEPMEVKDKTSHVSSSSAETENIFASSSISENANNTEETIIKNLNQSVKNEEDISNKSDTVDNNLTSEISKLKTDDNVKTEVAEESKVISSDKEKESTSLQSIDSSKPGDKSKSKTSSNRSKSGKYKLTRSNSSVSEILEKLEQKFQSAAVTETIPRKKSIASNLGEISSLLNSKEKDNCSPSTSNSGALEKEIDQTKFSSGSKDAEISQESTIPVSVGNENLSSDKPKEPSSTNSIISIKNDEHLTESSNKQSETEILSLKAPDELILTTSIIENIEGFTEVTTDQIAKKVSVSPETEMNIANASHNREIMNLELTSDVSLTNNTSNISSSSVPNMMENLSSSEVSIVSENSISAQTLNSEQTVKVDVQNTEPQNSEQSITDVVKTTKVQVIEIIKPTSSNQSSESIDKATEVLKSEQPADKPNNFVQQINLSNQTNDALNVEISQRKNSSSSIDNVGMPKTQNSEQSSEAGIQSEPSKSPAILEPIQKADDVQQSTDISASFTRSTSDSHGSEIEGNFEDALNEAPSNLTPANPITPPNQIIPPLSVKRIEPSLNSTTDFSPGTSSNESSAGTSSSESSPGTSRSNESSSSTSTNATSLNQTTFHEKVHAKSFSKDIIKSQNSEESDESVLSQTPPSPAGLLRNRFEGVREESPLRAMSPVRPQSPFSRMSFRARKEAIAQEKQRESKMTVESKPWFLQKVCPEPIKAATLPKRSIKQQLEMERRVRKMVSDRKCRTYRKAEIVVQLMDMNFEEEEALLAANECATLEQAISYLQQECLLCTGYYPVSQMISMVHCPHKACRDCIRAYFTVQIRDRTIMELLCPFCNEPDIGDEDVAQDYFNHLDIMLKKLVDYEIHELFQRKLRDRVLMKDPNFRWCSQCSSGFIANPNLKRLICPDCNAVTCASCRRPWEREHQGISCEAFAALKEASDPEAHAAGLAKLLTEDGIDCPSCHFRYALAKGGCMHFRCIQCLHDFCSGCSRPFKMGQKCGLSEFCAKLGLHAHHPRSCLFYLRDKDPEDLQRLLGMNDIEYNEDPPEGMDVSNTCQVLEQKETADGMVDDYCGKEVEKGYAGLCRIHYVEYLGQLVNKHRVDPIQIFENDDLELVLKRASIRLPPKRYRESDAEYREKLVKIIQEELPIDGMDGS